MDLSVVIVSWNTRDLLLDCLASVRDDLAAGVPLAAELFVVDNDSDDGSAATVRAVFPGVRVLEAGSNLGYARGANLALRGAAGRYLLLLNPDTRVHPGALRALVAALDADPAAAACGPALLNGDGSLQPSWARFPDVRSEWSGRLDRSQGPRPEEMADPARRAWLAPVPVDWVGGACLLVRADAVARAGLLDEGFFLYGEEVEWCHRLRRRGGGRTLLVPAATVTHYGGASAARVPAAETRRRLLEGRLRLHVALSGPLSALAPATVAAARHLAGAVARGLGRRRA